MATPASEPIRLVRSASLTITLYILVIVVSTMTTVKSAHAVGTVTASIASVSYDSGWWGVDSIHCSNYSSEAEVLSCFYQQWNSYVGDPKCSPYCYALCQYPVSLGNGFFSVNTWGYWAGGCSPGYIYNDYKFAYTYACPENSQPVANTPSCTCNDPYVPDSSATSCVAVNSCPANMSGSPCSCDPGYEPDPSGPGCALARYSLSLNTDPMDEVAPSGTAAVIATVEKEVGGFII